MIIYNSSMKIFIHPYTQVTVVPPLIRPLSPKALLSEQKTMYWDSKLLLIIPPLHRREGILFYLCPSFRPSPDIFRRIFLSNYWWQKSDIWSQASYRYAILWEAFLDPSDSYFLFADLVGFYTHWFLFGMKFFFWLMEKKKSKPLPP